MKTKILMWMIAAIVIMSSVSALDNVVDDDQLEALNQKINELNELVKGKSVVDTITNIVTPDSLEGSPMKWVFIVGVAVIIIVMLAVRRKVMGKTHQLWLRALGFKANTTRLEQLAREEGRVVANMMNTIEIGGVLPVKNVGAVHGKFTFDDPTIDLNKGMPTEAEKIWYEVDTPNKHKGKMIYGIIDRKGAKYDLPIYNKIFDGVEKVKITIWMWVQGMRLQKKVGELNIQKPTGRALVDVERPIEISKWDEGERKDGVEFKLM